MFIKKLILMLSSLIICVNAWCLPPVEVIHACKNRTAPNKYITLTEMDTPAGVDVSTPNCDFKAEADFNNIIYGYIDCNQHHQNLIWNNIEYDLKTVALNHSVNPQVTPGDYIQLPSTWKKIDFNGESYVCLEAPLSDSGDAVNSFQYYLIENAFNSNITPIFHYYFFDKEIMSLTSNE